MSTTEESHFNLNLDTQRKAKPKRKLEGSTDESERNFSVLKQSLLAVMLPKAEQSYKQNQIFTFLAKIIKKIPNKTTHAGKEKSS